MVVNDATYMINVIMQEKCCNLHRKNQILWSSIGYCTLNFFYNSKDLWMHVGARVGGGYKNE